jgi:hypothetical protein
VESRRQLRGVIWNMYGRTGGEIGLGGELEEVGLGGVFLPYARDD